jgi:protein tyrosine phosphatase (PTP) superfamily phosphohydrolase (DUF442 family)
MNSHALLSEIYCFQSIGDTLGTAGQPTEAQFETIRKARFDAIVNLALPTSDNALANEGNIVTKLGMVYVHIPVDFKAPSPQDFRTFCGVMATFDERSVFVHCVANKRVSAFVFLYRLLYLQVALADAERDLQAVWQPDEIWTRFIQAQLGSHKLLT